MAGHGGRLANVRCIKWYLIGCRRLSNVSCELTQVSCHLRIIVTLRYCCQACLRTYQTTNRTVTVKLAHRSLIAAIRLGTMLYRRPAVCIAITN